MAGMYKIVPVRLGEGLLTRFLYVKEHRDQGSELAGRDLFVSNTADMSAEEVAGLFGGCGAIEEVTVGAHLKGRGGGGGGGAVGSNFAHVIFKHGKGLRKAMALEDAAAAAVGGAAGSAGSVGLPLAAPSVSSPTGLDGLIAAHCGARVPPERLQAEVEAYCGAFEDAEERERAAKRRAEEEPDDDGFVMVTSKRAKTGEESTNKKSRSRPKKKKRELANFYAHQIRETKRNQLVELRQKFEEDKKRIEKLKAGRKFRPM
jgi:hypothetical protein